jgi:hypothetical protein
MDFEEFSKIPRLSREVVITEKIDGTNAQIAMEVYGRGMAECLRDWPVSFAKEVDGGTLCMFAGSRTRWITPGKQTDNSSFARWVQEHGEELLALGEGRHYGEWWGQGIQRNYGLKEKRFSLFNTARWSSEWNLQDFSTYNEDRKGILSTSCNEIPLCYVVPVLGKFIFDHDAIWEILVNLNIGGSYAAPNFRPAEGVVIYHTAGGYFFKKTIENDESPKSLVK